MIRRLLRLAAGLRAAATTQAKSMAYRLTATMSAAAHLAVGGAFRNTYAVECYGPDGKLKWRDEVHNLVVNTGLDDILNQYWKGSAYTASHFVGLTDGTPTVAAGDTMASHAGWVEVTAYSEANRQALTLGTVANQSVDNSGSKASFSINASATVGGAFITTNNTKGGTTGTLIGVGAFTGGDKSVANGDTLNVTATLTAASS